MLILGLDDPERRLSARGRPGGFAPILVIQRNLRTDRKQTFATPDTTETQESRNTSPFAQNCTLRGRDEVSGVGTRD